MISFNFVYHSVQSLCHLSWTTWRRTRTRSGLCAHLDFTVYRKMHIESFRQSILSKLSLSFQICHQLFLFYTATDDFFSSKSTVTSKLQCIRTLSRPYQCSIRFLGAVTQLQHILGLVTRCHHGYVNGSVGYRQLSLVLAYRESISNPVTSQT